MAKNNTVENTSGTSSLPPGFALMTNTRGPSGSPQPTISISLRSQTARFNKAAVSALGLEKGGRVNFAYSHDPDQIAIQVCDTGGWSVVGSVHSTGGGKIGALLVCSENEYNNIVAIELRKLDESKANSCGNWWIGDLPKGWSWKR